jgi:hypothetical protein
VGVGDGDWPGVFALTPPQPARENTTAIATRTNMTFGRRLNGRCANESVDKTRVMRQVEVTTDFMVGSSSTDERHGGTTQVIRFVWRTPGDFRRC